MAKCKTAVTPLELLQSCTKPSMCTCTSFIATLAGHWGWYNVTWWHCWVYEPIGSHDGFMGNHPWHKSRACYYSTGVQIVSCTLSDDSVLSESTGLFNPVLCVSQLNLFWQKNQPIRLCLSNQVRPGREWFPSPLGDFNRLFEGLIGELFKIWHWNMFYFFLNDISLAPKYKFVSLLCWLKQADCSVHIKK